MQWSQGSAWAAEVSQVAGEARNVYINIPTVTVQICKGLTCNDHVHVHICMWAVEWRKGKSAG
jgi:hypothetical protein